MNPYAIDNHHDTKPWDGSSTSPWRDWACWVPGRRESEPIVDRGPADVTTARAAQDAMK